MIVTKHFVYIHTPRTAETFLNKLILEHVPGAQMIQYNGHLRDLPDEFSHLPVIGFVRNPWDWYFSLFSDNQRKQQYVFQIISNGGALQAEETIARFLKLGDDSVESRNLLQQLVSAAPKVINSQTPPRRRNPGLRSEHFANFPVNHGYYSWLFQLMYESNNTHRIHIGRFENLGEEALRLFEQTGTTITKVIATNLNKAKAINSSIRSSGYIGSYTADLQHLVADKEKYLIDRFDYDFSDARWSKYPKADFFRHLGTANVNALVKRVKNVPDSLWVSENEGKPNKLTKLNDAYHIVFRFIDGANNVFDYHDFPIWHEWKDDLLPIMEQAAKILGYENCRFPRIMLAKLPAGSEILPHTDSTASHYIHKIHVPLITNSGTMFHVGDQVRNLPAGEVYEVNNKRNHAVENHGDLDRIHFIFECYNMDDYGKPN